MALTTAMPRLPPTCMAVCCIPPATPESSFGELLMTSFVPPTMTGLKPRPSSRKHRVVRTVPECASSPARAHIDTAMTASPAATGIRGPALPIQIAAGTAPTIISSVRLRTRTPDSAGERPSTFCR